MFAIWRVVVSALALFTPRTLRTAVEQSMTSLSLPGIVEQGHNGIHAGYAALVATLHVSGVALSGRSRPETGARMLYEVCSDGLGSNATGYEDCPSVSQPVSTVLPYDGTKSLSVYDNRRELAVLDNNRPRALAVYNRPCAPVVYTHPTDYLRLGFFWVDPRPYQVVANVYRRLFRDDGLLFKEYAHLDGPTFMHFVVDVEDPITLLATRLRESRRYLTIGKPQLRFEQRAGLLLAGLHIVGICVSLAGMALKALVRQLRARTTRRPILLFEPDQCEGFAVPPSTEAQTPRDATELVEPDLRGVFAIPPSNEDYVDAPAISSVPTPALESESADMEPDEQSEPDKQSTAPIPTVTSAALEVAALANLLAATELPTTDEPASLPETVSLGNLAPTSAAPLIPGPIIRMWSTSHNGRPRARATAARRVRCASSSGNPDLSEELRIVGTIKPLPASAPIRVRSTSHHGLSGVYAAPVARARRASSSGRLSWCYQVTKIDHGPDVPAAEEKLPEVLTTEEVPKAAPDPPEVIPNPPKPKRIRVFEATDQRPDVVERHRIMELRLQTSSTQPSWVFQASRGWAGQDERRRQGRRHGR